MNNGASLPDRIRSKIAAGWLPRGRPEKLGVHVQYELHFGGSRILRFHADCERIWPTETGHGGHRGER